MPFLDDVLSSVCYGRKKQKEERKGRWEEKWREEEREKEKVIFSHVLITSLAQNFKKYSLLKMANFA